MQECGGFMTNVVSYKAEELDISIKEVLRYLGYGRNSITEGDEAFAMSMVDKARADMKPMGCYMRAPVGIGNNGYIEMPYGRVNSANLSRNLSGCNEIYMFAVTLGAGYDRALNRAGVSSMTEAAYYQAVGAAAIEAVCQLMIERLELEVYEEMKTLRPRYSPGFGDYGLENQKGIFDCLNPAKYIGLTLMDTMVMSPEKSVTAIVGIEELREA